MDNTAEQNKTALFQMRAKLAGCLIKNCFVHLPTGQSSHLTTLWKCVRCWRTLKSRGHGHAQKLWRRFNVNTKVAGVALNMSQNK